MRGRRPSVVPGLRALGPTQDALQQYTPRQIRILFLLHNWAAILDYKRDSMEQAIVVETTLKVRARGDGARRRWWAFPAG